MLLPRRSLLIGGAAALIAPRPALAVIPFSMVAHATAAATNSPVTPAINTTGAGLLIVGTAFNSSPIPTLSDSKGNTWVPLVRQPFGGTSFTQMFYSSTGLVGTGHTFTLSGTGIFGAVFVQAWGGPPVPGSPADKQGSSQASGTTTVQPGSVTPSISNALIVTAVSQFGTGAMGIDSGFTITDQQPNGVSYGGALAYLIQTAIVPANPTWTAGSPTGFAATIATFNPGGAGLRALSLSGAGG